jgi:hypothetical protein
MSAIHSFFSPSGPGRRVCAFLGILLLFFCCQNARAFDHAWRAKSLPWPNSTHTSANAAFASRINLDSQVESVHPLFMANWVTQLLNKFESWLSNRTHMIQFCAIGMVVALFIIWWRKT